MEACAMKLKYSLLLVCVLMLLCGAAMADSISGCAYVDANENSVCDSGEQLMSGVPLTLMQQVDGQWQTIDQTVTNEYGKFSFNQLQKTEYRVACSLPGQELYAATIGGSSKVTDGVTHLDVCIACEAISVDVGLRPSARLTVNALADSDGDGLRGKYERDLPGVQVEVLSGDSVLAAGTTDKKGAVSLTAAPGEYTLRYTLPDNYGFTQIASESHIGLSKPVVLSAGSEAKVMVTARPVGFFSGMAFEDMNNNGVMDDGEPGVPGVTVYLNGQRTGTERSLTTDDTGVYYFGTLPDDKYTVTADLPQGMLFARYSKTGGDKRSIFTGSIVEREFSVKSSASVSNKNIGVVQKGAISGTAFFDLNYDGLWDEGEPGYAGVTVEAIKLSNGDSMGKAVTGEDGTFRLENLRGGDYRLRAILPDDGSIFSVTVEGAADQGNLFAHRTSRRENSVQPLSIESGGEASALIGVARGASVSGTVFQDADYNGTLNGKEKVLSGVKVRLVDTNGAVAASGSTSAKGVYKLEGIMPGEYTLQVQRKNDFGFTRLRPSEKGGSRIAVLSGDWGISNPMTIAMAETLTGVNAGMLPAATVSGSFFHDANDNGLWDERELGMLSAEVRLLSEDGEIDLYQTPAEDGSYFFDGVMPGKYTLTYLLPEHCEMAAVVSNGNTIKHEGLATSTRSFKIEMGAEVNMPLAGAVTLGSFGGGVFVDSNANGLREADEPMLAGAAIALTSSVTSDDVVTAVDGGFLLKDLRPAEYTLSITLPEGYIFSHEGTLQLQAAPQQTMDCSWQQLIDRAEKAIGAVRPASIAGEIWMDEDQNGIQAASEWIMEGVTLELVDEATSAAVATTVSGPDGFLFENVRPGTYTVRFDLPDQSTSANASASTFQQKGNAMVQSGLTVAEGENVTGLTTGLVSRTSIGGAAWLDENGQRSPVAGVVITLFKNGETVDRATTAEDGSYRFDGLWPGEYTLASSLPDGMIFVRPADPNYADGASFIDSTAEGMSDEFDLLMAQHQLSCDVLFIKPAKVGDIAWLDENANGLVDGSERRLPGVKVRLVQNGQTAYETTTNAYGYYLFGDVYPGEYVLEAAAWRQLKPTTPVESLRIISSCLTSGDGTNAASDPFRVESGETNANFDLGYVLMDGQTLPDEALADAPGRDWTLTNE